MYYKQKVPYLAKRGPVHPPSSVYKQTQIFVIEGSEFPVEAMNYNEALNSIALTNLTSGFTYFHLFLAVTNNENRVELYRAKLFT